MLAVSSQRVACRPGHQVSWLLHERETTKLHRRDESFTNERILINRQGRLSHLYARASFLSQGSVGVWFCFQFNIASAASYLYNRLRVVPWSSMEQWKLSTHTRAGDLWSAMVRTCSCTRRTWRGSAHRKVTRCNSQSARLRKEPWQKMWRWSLHPRRLPTTVKSRATTQAKASASSLLKHSLTKMSLCCGLSFPVDLVLREALASSTSLWTRKAQPPRKWCSGDWLCFCPLYTWFCLKMGGYPRNGKFSRQNDDHPLELGVPWIFAQTQWTFPTHGVTSDPVEWLLRSGRNGMQSSPLSRRYDLKPPVPPANAPSPYQEWDAVGHESWVVVSIFFLTICDKNLGI